MSRSLETLIGSDFTVEVEEDKYTDREYYFNVHKGDCHSMHDSSIHDWERGILRCWLAHIPVGSFNADPIEFKCPHSKWALHIPKGAVTVGREGEERKITVPEGTKNLTLNQLIHKMSNNYDSRRENIIKWIDEQNHSSELETIQYLYYIDGENQFELYSRLFG